MSVTVFASMVLRLCLAISVSASRSLAPRLSFSVLVSLPLSLSRSRRASPSCLPSAHADPLIRKQSAHWLLTKLDFPENNTFEHFGFRQNDPGPEKGKQTLSCCRVAHCLLTRLLHQLSCCHLGLKTNRKLSIFCFHILGPKMTCRM